MEVKLVARTLQVYETYARLLRPLSLTELSRELDAPMSSTLALVRTLVSRGYLYETRRRAGYYPTRKLGLLVREIDAADPLVEQCRPHMAALRDATGETVVLGKREGLAVVYLDVIPSGQAIRYTATAGETRSLHANSIGKALFSVLDRAEQDKLSLRIQWQSLTPHTLTDQAGLLADAAQSARRGWASNISESVPDLAAVAMPVLLAQEWYGVSVVGPLGRMQAQWERHIERLRHACDQLANTIQISRTP